MTATDEEIIFVHKDHLPDDVLPNVRWLVPMAYNSLHTHFGFINMVEVG
jgi:hypothetical protein